MLFNYVNSIISDYNNVYVMYRNVKAAFNDLNL